jgi:FixJ family two-component response regulator
LLFSGRTVSIIDDESSIREGVSSLLRSHGTTTHLFSSAAEFLGCGWAHTSNCLLVDVQMPVMSGPELYDELAKRNISIPTIFMSARMSHAVARRLQLASSIWFLEKPFEEAAIERVLRQALGTS